MRIEDKNGREIKDLDDWSKLYDTPQSSHQWKSYSELQSSFETTLFWLDGSLQIIALEQVSFRPASASFQQSSLWNAATDHVDGRSASLFVVGQDRLDNKGPASDRLICRLCRNIERYIVICSQHGNTRRKGFALAQKVCTRGSSSKRNHRIIACYSEIAHRRFEIPGMLPTTALFAQIPSKKPALRLSGRNIITTQALRFHDFESSIFCIAIALLGGNLKLSLMFVDR